MALPESTTEVAALKSAVESTDRTFENWWAVEVEARRLQVTDPDAADAAYAEGIRRFPRSGPLMAGYAVFLYNIRKDYDKAEEAYREPWKHTLTMPSALENMPVHCWEPAGPAKARRY